MLNFSFGRQTIIGPGSHNVGTIPDELVRIAFGSKEFTDGRFEGPQRSHDALGHMDCTGIALLRLRQVNFLGFEDNLIPCETVLLDLAPPRIEGHIEFTYPVGHVFPELLISRTTGIHIALEDLPYLGFLRRQKVANSRVVHLALTGLTRYLVGFDACRRSLPKRCLDYTDAMKRVELVLVFLWSAQDLLKQAIAEIAQRVT
jgi:hypothetical protein